MKPVNEAGHSITNLRSSKLNLSSGVSFAFECEHFNLTRTVNTCGQSMKPVNAKPKPVSETGQGQMKQVTETGQTDTKLVKSCGQISEPDRVHVIAFKTVWSGHENQFEQCSGRTLHSRPFRNCSKRGWDAGSL